jgi:hypothetical protein
MAEPPARPRVVSWCASLIMIGAAFLVLMAYQHVSELGSLESQEAAGQLLNDPPFDELGLTVDDVQRTERVLSLLAGGAAAAAAILGFEVLRRSRVSRRVLTFLAPVLLLAGMVVGGLIAFVVVAAIVMLWSPQAREWFGDPVPTEPTPPADAETPARQQPPREGGVAVLAPPPVVRPVVGPRRPRQVMTACIVTWITSALVSLGSLASMAVVLAAPDDLIGQLRDQNPQLEEQGISDGLVIGIVVATVVGLVLWSLAASVLAFLTMRRRRWAAITLLVSGGCAGALCLVSTLLGSVIAAVPLAGCVAVGILLTRPEAKAWFKD